jgi:hypothetical protein
MSHQRFPSAVRNATLVGPDSQNQGNRGVKVTLDVTIVPGGDTVQLVIENKDPTSGKYVQVLAAAAGAGVRTDTLTVFPGAPVAANVSANDMISEVYRIRVVHSAGSNFTYSVNVSELQ